MAIEQALTVIFDYGIKTLKPLHELTEKLDIATENSKAGKYEGHEIAADYSDGFIFLYGPDVEKLFEEIKPTLLETDFLKGARVKLRLGPDNEDVTVMEYIL